MIGLLLSLIGASISFIFLLLDKKDDKKRKLVLTLATIGFLTILGQQFLSYFSAKASDQIFQNLDKRTKVIDVKTTKINSRLSMIEVFISNLKSKSVDKIGIAVNTLKDLNKLNVFAKSNPDVWKKYRDWLLKPTQGKKGLKFTVNANRHYNHSLVLLYLITDENNRNDIEDIIGSYQAWSEFPKPDDKNLIESSKPLCDLVIFENKNGKILGFANTKELIENLMSLIDTKKIDDFRKALNSSNEDFDRYAKRHLTSFRVSASGKTLEEVGSFMINQNIAETVTNIQDKNFYLNLSRLFEIK